MDVGAAFLNIALAAGSGLLVGLQRESAHSALAGIRTFPIVCIFGAVAAMLAEPFGGWTVAAGLAAVGAICLVGNLGRAGDDPTPGVTTEAALLLIYGVGALIVAGSREVAVAIAAGMMILLHFKPALRGFATRMTERDLRAIAQFSAMSLVILPVLPNEGFGPYGVLNPHNIWLMAVLVVGVGLAGYVAHRLVGNRGGAVLAGLLGGLVSSTATTVSCARRVRRDPGALAIARVGILLATGVLYVRVIVEILAVAPALGSTLATPIGALLASAALGAGIAARGLRPAQDGTAAGDAENPTELRTPLLFALVYALVLLAVAWAKDALGHPGLYAVAAISGLTDMDAITISSARLAGSSAITPADAARAIVIASMANLAFKAGLAGVLGGSRLLRALAPAFTLQALTAAAIIAFWPGVGIWAR